MRKVVRVTRDAAGAEIIELDDDLARRATARGGLSFEELAARGAKAVAEASGAYRDVLGPQTVRLLALASGPLDAGTLAAAWSVAHDLKGQGGAFDFPLVTQIAGSTCKLIEALQRRPDAAAGDRARLAVSLHAQALALVHAKDLRGAQEEVGPRLLASLDALSQRTLGAG
jgi:hypothetical protein